jgi:hypothetical protein
LFLVPVGIGSGPLKTFLHHKQDMMSDLLVIVVFVMLSAHISIWNCFSPRFVVAFPFGNELFTLSCSVFTGQVFLQ